MKGQEKIAFEFKFSGTPKASQAFYQTLDELNITKAYIVCPIQDSYEIHPKVKVTGLKSLIINKS